jgi:hypothetical protein
MLIIMHAPPSGGVGAKDDTDDCTDIFESEKARLLSMLVGRDLLIPEQQYKTDDTGAEDTVQRNRRRHNRRQARSELLQFISKSLVTF